jgi:ABC-2 type transport system ATP-binding protein
VTETALLETALLEATSLSRAFGATVAVHDVTLRVTAGEVVGLLGHNGAGKSTTMRMLAGALAPTSGGVKVGGYDSKSVEARRRVGWLPEVPPLTDELNVREQLAFAAGLRGLGAADVTRALERCDLAAQRGQLNATLSKGTKQRVGLAQALLGDPPVLLLDEPTAGMDPKQAASLRDLVRSLSPTRAIVMSTHLLHEVTALCTRVVLVRAGRVVVDEPLAALRARGPSIEATVLALLEGERASASAEGGA